MNDLKFNKLQNKQYVSIIGLIFLFSPFTILKVGFFGISELLVFLLFILIIINRNSRLLIRSFKNSVFIKFWYLFILANFIGLINNYLFLEVPSGNIQSMLLDMSAYLFIFLTSFTLEVTFSKQNVRFPYIKLIIRMYVFLSLLIMFFLILSNFSSTFLGLPVMHHTFFAPLSSNLHHFGMVIGPLIFVGLLLIVNEKKVSKKLFLVGLFASNVLAAFNVGAAKVNLGIYAGFILLSVYILIELLKKFDWKLKFSIYTFISLLITTFISFFYQPLTRYTLDAFSEEDVGGARSGLYSQAIEKGFKSFLTGYGPGGHVEISALGLADVHQTILTIFLQAGVLGVILFIILYVQIVSTCFRNKYIMAAIMPITVYLLGGDILRRLPIWILLIVFYYYCKDKNIEKKKQIK